MSTTFNSNFKRFVTFLLIIVMVVGMLPSTASAMSIGSGSLGFGDFPVSGDGEQHTGSWPAMNVYGRFTRYTLVYFPFSDNAEDANTLEIPASKWMSQGQVIGSIDVITEINNPIPDDTTYLADGSGNLSNAFEYRKSNKSLGISVTGTRYLALKEDSNNKPRVFDISQIRGGPQNLHRYPTWAHQDITNYDGGDPLASELAHLDSGTVANDHSDLYSPNVVFNDILEKIYRSSNNPNKEDLVDRSRYDAAKSEFTVYNEHKQPSTPEALGADCVYVYNFIDGAIDHDHCYRLLAEPGIIMDAPSDLVSIWKFKPMALTLRDISSIVLHQHNPITDPTLYHGNPACPYDGGCENVSGTWGKACTHHSYQFYFIWAQYWYYMRHAFGLFNSFNAFRTFSAELDGDKITDIEFNKTWDYCFSRVAGEWLTDNWVKHHSINQTTLVNDNWHSMYSLSMATLNDFDHKGDGTRSNSPLPSTSALGTWDYPSFGLAIVEPASMLPQIPVPTGDRITVKKIIAGDLMPTVRSKFKFDISIPSDVYQTLTTTLGVKFHTGSEAGPVASFNDDGAGNMVYTTPELGHEGTDTIYVTIEDEANKTEVNNLFSCTIKEVDVEELFALNEGVTDEDQKFKLFINDAENHDTGMIEGVKLGTTTVFKNQMGKKPEGNLHVIVDYNLPGATASSDPADPMNGNVLDCGIHPAGEVVELALVAKGTALNSPGKEVTGIANGVHFKFKDLSLKADGVTYQIDSNDGKILGSDGNVYRYQLPTDVGDEEKLLILYVIWDITVDPPDHHEEEEEEHGGGSSNIYTGYWDLGSGYDGGGITSQTCGQIVIPALNLTATASCGCGTGTARAQRKEIKIDFGFDPPRIFHNFEWYRPGHYFVGWLNTDMEATPYNYAKYVADYMSCNGTMDVTYKQNELVPGSYMNINGTDWLAHITDSPEAPGKSTTFCAVWAPGYYSWDANGGYFKTDAAECAEYPDNWSGQFPTCCGLSTELGLTKFTWKQIVGQQYHAYSIPRREPIRVGYTFTGWYWDPSCTIPVDRNEEGMMPGRTYYAGWEAEPVYVTYYDTREGNNVVTIQEYKYDDRLDLAEDMASTIGWDFDWWGKSADSGEFGDKTILDLDCLEAHENRYPDGLAGNDMLAGPNTGPNQNGAGAGVVSGKHYWTLNLYSVWNQQTADYFGTFHFNDYNNNDGARPVKITVGVVDSITNREVASTEVDLTINGRDTAEEFTTKVASGLAMTNNNSSTERVKYYMYLKDYTDIDGDTYVIQNTSASTGEIGLASVSNADTSPLASYRYTVNQVNTGNVTDQPNVDYPNDGPDAQGKGKYTGTMYFDHNLMTTGDDIEFTIRWNDQSNQDGMRPETLKLTLMGCGADGQWKPVQQWTSLVNGQVTNQAHQSNSGVVYVNSGICDVSADGNVWTYIFKDFQKYDRGEYIKYAVRVEGYEEYSYTPRDVDPNGNEDGIVLDYKPVTAPVPVDIHWHDNANQDGMRPSSVVVELVAHQWNRALGAYESVVVTGKRFSGFSSTSNVWSSSFDNMPVYHGSEPIIYHLVVTSDLNGNMDDDSNPYTWSEGIVGNPYKDGARPSVDIYHNADERSVTATVQWDDNGNQDGKRPDSVTLQLYANNEPVPGDEYTVVLTGDPKALTWNYTFEHLDVYTEGRSGKEIVYKVKILDAQGGEFESYTPSYINKNGQFVETFGASGEAFVLMSYKPKTGTVSGAVYWQDDNNRDGQRPDFVTVALHASAFDNSTGEWIDYVAATKTVRSDGDNTMTVDRWRFEFGNMPVYRGSQPITYYITVTSDLNGNTDDTALLYGWGEKDRGDMASDPELEVSVTVYQGVETISVTATVEWDDDNNNDGLRPNAVQLQLYADLLYT